MKLVSFLNPQKPSWGPKIGALMPDGSVVDFALSRATRGVEPSEYFSSMLALIEAGEEGLAAARIEIETGGGRTTHFQLLAPIPVPPQIRDAMCFELHIKQSLVSICKLKAIADGKDQEEAVIKARENGQLQVPDIWYKQPLYYKANRFAVCGPEQDIIWPSYSTLMDYECEIACIIGKKGVDIKPEEAHAHIFGYTIFNDFSARDAQFAEIQGFLGPAKGKDFDGANAMGPCIVTADEFNPKDDHQMVVRVNGEMRSCGSSLSMHWGFDQYIAHVTQGETLYPGEILGSGTVGNGCGLELMQFLKEGDVVELEIPAIGVLKNTVIR